MNKVILIGRTTKDIELRSTQSGISVCALSLALDEGKSENGENKTQFIDCVAWRGTAEFLAKYITKGTRVAVEGRLQKRNYQTQSGENRFVTEVVVERAEFADGKREADPCVPAPANNTAPVQTNQAPVQAKQLAYTAPQQQQIRPQTPTWDQMSNDDDLPF